MKARLRIKLRIPPVKKTIRCFSGPTFFSSVFPKTKRKSMLPNKCKALAWTNSAATSVQNRCCSRLDKLTITLRSANAGGSCQAHRLAPMHANISSELVLKELSKESYKIYLTSAGHCFPRYKRFRSLLALHFQADLIFLFSLF